MNWIMSGCAHIHGREQESGWKRWRESQQKIILMDEKEIHLYASLSNEMTFFLLWLLLLLLLLVQSLGTAFFYCFQTFFFPFSLSLSFGWSMWAQDYKQHTTLFVYHVRNVYFRSKESNERKACNYLWWFRNCAIVWLLMLLFTVKKTFSACVFSFSVFSTAWLCR